MAVAQGAQCVLHPDQAAVATCTRCGTFVCRGCGTRRNFYLYCPSCVARLGGNKPSDSAYTAVVLGALGLGCYLPILGIPALIVGTRELDRINRGEAPEEGRIYAQAARICGWIGICLTGLVVVIGLVVAIAATASG